MNQMQPFVALLSAGGGHKNGTCDALGLCVISAIRVGKIGQPPHSMPHFQSQQQLN